MRPRMASLIITAHDACREAEPLCDNEAYLVVCERRLTAERNCKHVVGVRRVDNSRRLGGGEPWSAPQPATAADVGKHDDHHALLVNHNVPHIPYKASPCLAARLSLRRSSTMTPIFPCPTSLFQIPAHGVPFSRSLTTPTTKTRRRHRSGLPRVQHHHPYPSSGPQAETEIR